MQEDLINNKKLLQNKIAKIINKHRIQKNKSISLISAEIGMTKSMWADLERGIKDPQISTLWRIAEALEIPLSEIIKELEKNLNEDFSLIN